MTPVAQLMAWYPRIYFACHTRHVRDSASGKALSAHQAGILDHLDEMEPTGLNELASHMGVTPSTMCITIDRLIRAGYVTREPDPRDGRRVALRITKAGARLRDERTVLDKELVRGLLSTLTPADRRAAMHGLGLLARAADDFMSERSAGKHRQTSKAEGRAV